MASGLGIVDVAALTKQAETAEGEREARRVTKVEATRLDGKLHVIRTLLRTEAGRERRAVPRGDQAGAG